MNLNTTAKDNKASSLTFSPKVIPRTSEVILIGRQELLKSGTVVALIKSLSWVVVPYADILHAMIKTIKGSGKASTFMHVRDEAGIPLEETTTLTIIVLPPASKISRNDNTFAPHFITDSLSNLHSSACESTVQIHVIDGQIDEMMCCTAAAIARALPLYHSKSTNKNDASENVATGVNVSFYNEEGQTIANDSLWQTARAVAEGVRLSARLGDMPPAELNPDTYSKECKDVTAALVANGANVTFQEIVGEELKDGGYGGIYGVGMAAQCPPRMVIMTYTPDGGEDNAKEHVVLCGKGVIYDTGGLALKPKIGMCGMKHDMGGSAGVLGGFQASVQLKLPRKITLILAIVENAISQHAVRNDDILTMKSGKTVEINNTDAEGRLILADCVSHASNNVGNVDVILDMATLTGAQLVCTGKKHAGILAKTRKMEERIVNAGLKSGDLCFPMLYFPELLMVEFASKVADMKNSVKDRGNAQSSCAGHFIESHIDENYEGDWVHVDMAGPDSKNERATGYGVALVLGLLEAPGF